MGFWAQLIEKIMAVWPEINILGPYEAGIRITFGKRCRAKGPGWYMSWPMIQKFLYMEVQTQLVDLRGQSIRTSDGYDVAFSGAIQYNIRDIVKAMCNVQDVDKSLATLGIGIITDYVSRHTIDECQNVELLKQEIKQGVRSIANGWGLKIDEVYITDFGKARNIRLLGGFGVVGYGDSDGD